MDKPTIEQVGWVFKHLKDHLDQGGSFKYLIYERLGFGLEAYSELCNEGGMAISNALQEVWCASKNPYLACKARNCKCREDA